MHFPVGAARRSALKSEEGNSALRNAGRGQACWEAPRGRALGREPSSERGRALARSLQSRPSGSSCLPGLRRGEWQPCRRQRNVTARSWWRTEAPGPNVRNVPLPYVFCAMAGRPPSVVRVTTATVLEISRQKTEESEQGAPPAARGPEERQACAPQGGPGPSPFGPLRRLCH